MTPLEQKLVENMVRDYKSRGINVQRILDNPDFISLPLDSKVHALERYAADLHTASMPDPLNAIKGAAGTALLTGSTVLLSRILSKYLTGNDALGEPFGKPVLAAAAIGGAIGLVARVKRDLDQYNNDKAIAKELNSGNTIGVLSSNSILRQDTTSAINNKIKGSNPMAQVVLNYNNMYHGNLHHTGSFLDLFKSKGNT